MIRIVGNVLRYSVPLTMLVLAGTGALGENAPSAPAEKISQVKAKAEHGFVQQQIELANACIVRLKGAVDPELLRIAIHAAGRIDGNGRGGD